MTRGLVMSQPLAGFDEAVLVLANLMDAEGRLNEDSLIRLALAAVLVQQRPRSCLITSGWNYRPDTPIRIADVMGNAAHDTFGIARDRIFADGTARDTVGDAIMVKRNLLDPSRIRSVAVVSSRYHLPRVRGIFAFVFGSAYDMRFIGPQVDHAENMAESETASLAAFHATFAGVEAGNTEAIYQRLVSEHPRYNGTVFPALTGLER